MDTVISSYSGLFVCSAGNDGYDIDSNLKYPASYNLENKITVGALTRVSDKCEQSNYGKDSVDIYAPGQEICSTFPNNTYAEIGGTSMTAPFVTGVAALLLSIKPELSVYQIKRAILDEADSISITLPNGTRQTVKKLNAFGAVKYVLSGYAGPHDLCYGNVAFDRNINSDKTLFFEKNALERLIVKSQFDYGFSISANGSIYVALYDENFNAIALTITRTDLMRRCSFNVNLSAGTYYLRIKYTETGLSGNASVAITCPPHTHDFSNWVYKDRTSHVQTCECGANNGVTGAHQIDP